MTLLRSDRALLTFTLGLTVMGGLYMPIDTVIWPTHFQSLDNAVGLGIVMSSVALGVVVGAFGAHDFLRAGDELGVGGSDVRLLRRIPREVEEAAACLGAKPWQVFLTISLPLASSGVIIGSILCFSRSLGEFGATMTFVGNIPGETRTIPLAIYSFIQQPDGEAAAARLVVLSMLLAFAALLANYWITQRYQQKIGTLSRAQL